MKHERKEVLTVNFIALRGGGVSYAYEMTKALSKHTKLLCIISSEMENYQKWLTIKQADFIVIKGYSNKFNFLPRLLKFLLSTYKYKKILKKYKSSFVYIPMISYWTPFVNSLFKKSSLIYTCHDPKPHVKSTLVTNYFNKRMLIKSRKVILLSQQFERYICETYNKDFRDILHLNFSTQDYYPISTKTCIYNSDEINFLYFGHIRDNKGLDILLNSYEIVQNALSNISLTIAGNGDFSPYRNKCAELKNLKLYNRWIKDEEVSDFFNGKNIIVVLPYKTATQSGIIPIAMHYGLPIIASNVGGISEQIIDNQTGILTTPNDVNDLANKMIFLANNSQIREMLSKNSQNEIRKTSWDNQALKLLNFIEKE